MYLMDGKEHAEAVAFGFELRALGVCLAGQQVHDAPRPASAFGRHRSIPAEWKIEAVSGLAWGQKTKLPKAPMGKRVWRTGTLRLVGDNGCQAFERLKGGRLAFSLR